MAWHVSKENFDIVWGNNLNLLHRRVKQEEHITDKIDSATVLPTGEAQLVNWVKDLTKSELPHINTIQQIVIAEQQTQNLRIGGIVIISTVFSEMAYRFVRS